MTHHETTLTVGINEQHTRVVIVIGDRAISCPAEDGLTISARILDAAAECSHDSDLTPIAIDGLPAAAVTVTDARLIARGVAAAADQLLTESEQDF